MECDGPLNDDEAARVFRRATELDAAAGDGGRSGWDPALEQATTEAGISPSAVRRALDELAAGALAPVDASTVVPVEAALAGGGRDVVRAVRSVPGDPATVRAALDDFFANQLLEPPRDRTGA